MAEKRRVEVAFFAGASLSLRLEQEQYDKLRDALRSTERWHEVDAEDATVTLDLSKVTYVRLDTESGRVGF